VTQPSLARSAPTGTTEQDEAHHELLAAARAALKYLDDLDAHAPEGVHFGGESKIRRQLRRAIARAAR
jgi:hypothetical protein